jgi:hypothetical protein
VAIVWPCPLPVDVYVAAGRGVEFPRPECPSCAGPLVLWSGYRRHRRAAGRCRKIFVPRLRCGRCRVTHALLPASGWVRWPEGGIDGSGYRARLPFTTPCRLASRGSAEGRKPGRAETKMIKSRGAEGKAGVTFTVDPAVGAQMAAICGDWNDWSADADIMRRDAQGGFSLTVDLEPGRTYRFRYLLDGERWDNDWAADAYVRNSFGGDDSVVDLTVLAEPGPPATKKAPAKKAPAKKAPTKQEAVKQEAVKKKKKEAVKKEAVKKEAAARITKKADAPATKPGRKTAK